VNRASSAKARTRIDEAVMEEEIGREGVSGFAQVAIGAVDRRGVEHIARFESADREMNCVVRALQG